MLGRNLLIGSNGVIVVEFLEKRTAARGWVEGEWISGHAVGTVGV